MKLRKGKGFYAALSVAPLRGLWAYCADHNPHSDCLTSALGALRIHSRRTRQRSFHHHALAQSEEARPPP